MTSLANQIDRDYVVDRITDWVKRINDLYAILETWVEDIGDVQISRTEVLQAREELMQEFGVEPKNIPAITLRSDNNRVSIMPMGLWVIGANGRLNIKTNKNCYILIDIGGKDDDPSEWVLVSPLKRGQQIPINKLTIAKLIKDEDPFV